MSGYPRQIRLWDRNTPLEEARLLVEGKPEASLELIYSPDAASSVEDVTVTRDRVYISILSNVTGKLLAASRSHGEWTVDTVDLPGNGSLDVRAADDSANDVFVSFESFLQPETLSRVMDDGEIRVVQALPERFDASRFVTEQ